MTVYELQQKRTDTAARIKAAGDKFSRGTGWPSDADKKAYDQANADYEQVVRDLEIAEESRRVTNNPHNLGREDRGGTPERVASDILTARDGSTTKILERSDSFQSESERRSGLSIGRFAKGIITGRWEHAEQERSLLESSGSAGGHLVPSPLFGSVIDYARAKSVCLSAGVKTVRMDTETLNIARVQSDPTVQWHAESQTITASEPVFEKIILRAKTAVLLIPVSIELVEDAVNFVPMMEQIMSGAIASEVDRAILEGDFQNGEPMGIRGTTGVTEISSVGVLAYDDLLDGLYYPQSFNGDANAIVMNPREASSVRKMKNGDGAYLLDHPDIMKLGKYTSTGISTTRGGGTESCLYIGDFRRVLLGVRSEGRLEVFRSGTVGSVNAVSQMMCFLRLYFRLDVHLEYPKHMVFLSGITP